MLNYFNQIIKCFKTANILFTLFNLFLYFAVNAQQNPYLIILGVAQDGGYPHIGCKGICCSIAQKNISKKKQVVSFALVNPLNKKWYLFEATPDITQQLCSFAKITHAAYNYLPDAIFITHAHIGHYTGLMYLGREAKNALNVPVYILPQMKSFIQTNEPWNQLVQLKNILPITLQRDVAFKLDSQITINCFGVPHRDEFSETAGFNIITSGKKYLFIPDIDKWEKFDKNILVLVKQVDVALLDATFYSNNELPGRNIEEVPHPFVTETMKLFNNESWEIKRKIYFIHFNHTNKLLWDKQAIKKFLKTGFNLAAEGKQL